ncbi:MAG TPA: MFS transporter [Gemmatimonadaceae bacterium]|jgi:MFS family permease
MDSRRGRLADFFGLERNIVAVAAAMFLIALGENLWRRFLPRYLQALGAPITAIGLFGTVEDLLDGVYQYPGGWIADRFGRRRALLAFIALAATGYAVFLLMSSWWIAFIGLALVMVWDSMASPTLFAVVGDALPRAKRTMGFTVQSVLRRVPIVIAPVIGGVMVARLGIVQGVRGGLLISIGLAAVTLVAASRIRIPVIPDEAPINIHGVWRRIPPTLRWLLVSDIFIRTCDAMVDVFLVIFAVTVIRVSALDFGVAVAVQALTAILVYIPAARIAERTGKKPFVIATFVAFAFFPLAVVWSTSFAWLLASFVVGGLREIGEPARKALIIDLAEPALRARVVGLYYLGRSVAIAPAAFIGGVLWRISPVIPFYVAAAIGAIGVIVFVATVSEQQAG